jgi:hypothetical protein
MEDGEKLRCLYTVFVRHRLWTFAGWASEECSAVLVLLSFSAGNCDRERAAGKFLARFCSQWKRYNHQQMWVSRLSSAK